MSVSSIKKESKIDLHPIEKQLILYTKLQFGKIDYDEDLKYFAARLYGLLLEHVEQYTINDMILNLYDKLVKKKYIHFDFEKILNETFKYKWMYESKAEVSYMDIMKRLLGHIQGIKIKGLDLGDIDQSIFKK